MRQLKPLVLAIAFVAQSLVVLAQHHHAGDVADTTSQKMTHSAHGDMHTMSHAFSRSLPMSRNGSGTGWLPDNSPMYGYMLHKQKWMYMFHGNVFLRYNNQDVFNNGTRGDAKVDAPNWFMAMGQRPVGKRGLLRFSAMITLDALTVGGSGYPLLYQSGETWKSKPLVDHQHPHDLFSELSVAYTHQLGKQTDAFVYLAYPGEPALGPVAFMHRPSSLYNPDAPIGHHWQDATHVTFGVATLGIRHQNMKLEGSVFTGREPDEDRYGFDKPRFDSYSLRLSYNPVPALALQLSQAWINDLHEFGPREDVRKTTASVIHSAALGNHKAVNTTVVWGYNRANNHGDAHSVLAETAFTFNNTAVYGKYEWVQKSAQDLLLGEAIDHHRLFPVNAATLGVQQSVANAFKAHIAIGAQASWYPAANGLEAIYGRNPVAAQVYLRLYPGMMHAH